MKETLKSVRTACARQILDICFAAQANHIGSSLSCLELLVDLYHRRMRSSDRFILSKGHAAPALYSVLASKNKISQETLHTFGKDGTLLGLHPPTTGELVDDIPFGTGSLGHGLSLASGLALGARLQGASSRIYCLLSEGDCNEGSTWEAALFAGHHRLAGITAILDLNGLQAMGPTREILDLEPLVEKWRSFGWSAARIANGNDFDEIENGYHELETRGLTTPRILIAQTTKGHGIGFMENRFEWHYHSMTENQYQAALRDLGASPSFEAPE